MSEDAAAEADAENGRFPAFSVPTTAGNHT